MSKEEKLDRAKARLDAIVTNEAASLLTLKNAVFDVLMRDGAVEWDAVERLLVGQFATSTGLTKRRLAAAIDHLHELVPKAGSAEQDQR